MESDVSAEMELILWKEGDTTMANKEEVEALMNGRGTVTLATWRRE